MVQWTRKLSLASWSATVHLIVCHRSPAAKRYAFHLNLDSAISVPITLKDVSASHTFLDGLDATARNPTGKFYKGDHATALVDALKAKASYARVTPGEAATDDHKKHLERFISRLQDGELVCDLLFM